MENYIKKNSIGLAWRNAIEKVFEKGKTVHDGEVKVKMMNLLKKMEIYL